MRHVLIGGLILGIVGTTVVLAQQAQEDTRSKESYRLELKYTEDAWKACRVNLASIWEQGNVLEQENKRLKDEIAQLRRASVAQKEEQHAPLAQ